MTPHRKRSRRQRRVRQRDARREAIWRDEWLKSHGFPGGSAEVTLYALCEAMIKMDPKFAEVIDEEFWDLL